MKFIHKHANIEGDVAIGDGSSVWAFASIRGDEGLIRIGKNVSVQDNCTIHGHGKDYGVIIGDNVTVGHGAVIDGGKIGNNCLIGINATVLHDTVVEDWVLVGAGAVVPPNSTLESGHVYVGNPAKKLRALSKKDKDYIIMAVNEYQQLASKAVERGARK